MATQDGSAQSTVAGPPVENFGFEMPIVGPVGQSSSWLYDPPGAFWEFVGEAGISANGSALTSGNPDTLGGRKSPSWSARAASPKQSWDLRMRSTT